MLLSVIIPTCNRKELLSACLERLAPGKQNGLSLVDAARSLGDDRQGSGQESTEPEYEVIVTDDGTDQVAEQLVQESFPWARWLRGPIKGPAANRNHGASQARGEWLVFTDDDCLPDPVWLQAYVAAIGVDADAYEGQTTCRAGLRSPLQTSPVNDSGGYLWSCNMAVRRIVFQTLGGFDTGFPAACNEDVEFRERLLRQGYRFQWVPKAVVDHPPRPQVLGIAMGRRGESQVRLWYARGNKEPMGFGLLAYLFKYRLREIYNLPFGFGSLVWFGSTLVELTYILFHLRTWNARQRNAYIGSGGTQLIVSDTREAAAEVAR